MTVRHPGISPTNDLVAKKIFSNPEITCQFIRDMLDLPAKNVTILEGSNIHVLPSMPYSAQDFYTSIDVLAELDNGTQVIIEIQVHHQNFFINRLWAYLCSQVNQNLEKIRQRKGDTHKEIIAKLDYEAPLCPDCGSQMKKYDFQKPSKIPYLDTTGIPTRILLRKRRFKCYLCSKMMVAETSIVKKNHQIPRIINQKIA